MVQTVVFTGLVFFEMYGEKGQGRGLARPRGQAYLLSCKEGAIALSHTHACTDQPDHYYMCTSRHLPARSIVLALYPSTTSLPLVQIGAKINAGLESIGTVILFVF